MVCFKAMAWKFALILLERAVKFTVNASNFKYRSKAQTFTVVKMAF